MKRNLVSESADALRERVFAQEPGALLGSLQDLARGLGVGIVTLQQAARLLEHEGLLEARRGPGGGYYGTRPDEAALERAIAVYLRTHPASFGEALNITSLLFNEICAAAAGCGDAAQREELTALAARIDLADSDSDQGRFEADFQDLRFRMVRWPLFELLTPLRRNPRSPRDRQRCAGSMEGGSPPHHRGDPCGRWRAGPVRGGAQQPAGGDGALIAPAHMAAICSQIASGMHVYSR